MLCTSHIQLHLPKSFTPNSHNIPTFTSSIVPRGDIIYDKTYSGLMDNAKMQMPERKENIFFVTHA